jgi:hypothetical protein
MSCPWWPFGLPVLFVMAALVRKWQSSCHRCENCKSHMTSSSLLNMHAFCYPFYTLWLHFWLQSCFICKNGMNEMYRNLIFF